MSNSHNGNGNGNGNGQVLVNLAQPSAQKKPVSAAGSPGAEFKSSRVFFKVADEGELSGALMSMTRQLVVFELYNPRVTFRLSEVLDEFKIIFQERTIYSGRAVIQDTVQSGAKVVCQATLNETQWSDIDLSFITADDHRLLQEFNTFFAGYQKLQNVLPEYKDAVANIETFLTHLRLWLEQIETGIRSLPELQRARAERNVIDKLSPRIIPMIDTLFERFERITATLDAAARPIHRSYIQRQLHPIVLCAPFADRAYHKPLGYPGDYEMVNMMARDPQEGASVFAKIFNVWLHHQGSALAHRNRLVDLVKRIEAEAVRVSHHGGKARIFNFACGPAIEVQNFLAQSELGEKVEFVLSDFNTETLKYTERAIDEVKRRRGWRTAFQYQKKAVHQLIKESQKSARAGEGGGYDLVYCAGLFDYLNDQTCQILIKIFYQMLAPGGLLYITNVTPLTTNRGSLELILDWHLIYRDAKELAELCDGIVSPELVRVRSDETGINIFLEARKPHGN